MCAIDGNRLLMAWKWLVSDPEVIKAGLKNSPKMIFPIKKDIKKEDTEPASSF